MSRFSFNGTYHTSETISANHGFGTRLGTFEAENTAACRQVHSAKVIYTDTGGVIGECDGLVTDKAGLALSVRTADCVPILFCDSVNGVIAAAHAGWRGTVSKIAVETLNVMIEYGAELDNIHAAVGASIHECCYEVKDDFIETVNNRLGAEFVHDFIHERCGKYYADVAGIDVRLLLQAGIKSDNIDVCSLCTCCNQDLFYSYRGSGVKNATMRSVIMM